MLRWPEPNGVPLVSYPAPSSDTVKRREPSRAATQIRTSEAAAYFAMFCSASRQQKYAAASMSWSNRPMPSASTSTGIGDLSACARRAAISPLSASSGG